jgi:(R)-2-hydroxyglutarate---pyruvate transhydrogenase
MNKILGFDPLSGVVTAEAGAVLADLDAFLAERGFTMPLDLAAKGS